MSPVHRAEERAEAISGESEECHKSKVHLLRTPCAAQCAKAICIEFRVPECRNKQTHISIMYSVHIIHIHIYYYFFPVCLLNNPHRYLRANAGGHTLISGIIFFDIILLRKYGKP